LHEVSTSCWATPRAQEALWWTQRQDARPEYASGCSKGQHIHGEWQAGRHLASAPGTSSKKNQSTDGREAAVDSTWLQDSPFLQVDTFRAYHSSCRQVCPENDMELAGVHQGVRSTAKWRDDGTAALHKSRARQADENTESWLCCRPQYWSSKEVDPGGSSVITLICKLDALEYDASKRRKSWPQCSPHAAWCWSSDVTTRLTALGRCFAVASAADLATAAVWCRDSKRKGKAAPLSARAVRWGAVGAGEWWLPTAVQCCNDNLSGLQCVQRGTTAALTLVTVNRQMWQLSCGSTVSPARQASVQVDQSANQQCQGRGSDAVSSSY